LLAHTSLSFFVENEEGIWIWPPVTKRVRIRRMGELRFLSKIEQVAAHLARGSHARSGKE
jgi:hypothetical protein